jgi:NAD(P)-dependent dehydrogenase (short-subunit alcohol dehydrogenase family)
VDLISRSVLVTGAGSGIGRSAVHALARKGCRLVLLGRRASLLENVAGEARTLGGLAHVVAGDVTDPAVRTQAIEAAAAEFGGLDMLVNSAGAVSGGRLGWVKEDEIRAMVEVNLLAPILLAREALIRYWHVNFGWRREDSWARLAG